MTIKKVVQGLIVTAALCLSTTSVRAQGYRLFIMGADSSLSDKRSFTEGYLPYTSGYAGRQGDRGTRSTAGQDLWNRRFVRLRPKQP